MATETERKFLINNEAFRDWVEDFSDDAKVRFINQYYLVSSKEFSVRIRSESFEHCVLCIKHGAKGISVNELEFEIEFLEYFKRKEYMVGVEIIKTRWMFPYNGRTWEIDEFEGELEGLIVAEIEGDDVATLTDFPDFIRREVTHLACYKNAVLATSDDWKDDYYGECK